MGNKLDFDAVEGYIANHLRLFISMVAALLIFVAIIAVSAFFIAVKGAEQTMVPNVRGLDLTSALMELQVKELYPRIQLRYSQSSADKGLILEQDPAPGTIVKAGRRIRLVVSQGVLVNTVEDYLGRNIDDIRMDLQTLFATEGTLSPPLLSLKEPPMYEYSIDPPGKILQQKPEPGSRISGPTQLELVVSLGPEDALLRLPNLIGLDPEEALEQIGYSGIDFIFSLRQAQEGEASGVVIGQVPAGDSMIAKDTRVRITMTAPQATGSDTIFGLFRYSMAKNPYPLALRLEAQLPSGERRRLLSTEYSGGELTVPYNLPLGTVLILSLLNREIHRETVIMPIDTSGVF